MKNKRIIALILVVVMSLSALASCGGDTKHTRAKGDGSNIDTNFPAADYDGEVFTFATFTSELQDHTVYYAAYEGSKAWIDSDDISGVATSDAVYTRNQLCEQKYNITIENELKGEDYDDYKNLYIIGDQTFDVVYGWANRFALGVTSGQFYDFADLDDAGYIDMSQSYWNPDVNYSLSVADRYFLATNDITMESIAWTGCMFFNPQIVEDYGLENPHDLVYSNEWTVDKFLEMVAAVHGDLDGQADFTIEDCYGLIDLGTTGALLYGCDCHLVDDDYQLAIGSERITNLITKIHQTLDDTSHVFSYDAITNGADTGGNPWKYARSYFANGHSLFLTGTPDITEEFRNMETGYGIVPMPKFDSNQEDFVAAIDSCSGVFIVPNFEKRSDGVNSSYERTGMILEYLAYKSSEDKEDSVLNAYYETTIKGQRQTIEENKNMLDMIKGHGSYEWAQVFWVGGDPSDDSKTIAGVLGEMASSGRGLASKYKQNQKRLQEAIDTLYESIDGLD